VAQVFDDKATFAEWFGDALGKNSLGAGGADEWLQTEKRVVVIHRLHQILEPFMLRRQVQDVEGKLPPKVSSRSWRQSLSLSQSSFINGHLIADYTACAACLHHSHNPMNMAVL